MEEPVFQALAIVYQHWLNTFLEAIPYEEFFLSEEIDETAAAPAIPVPAPSTPETEPTPLAI